MAAPTIGEAWQAELRKLKVGWAGGVGEPITREAIATVEAFATVPTSDGGIQLEIHQDGFDIEIDIGPDGKLGYVLIGPNQYGSNSH